MRNNWGSMKVFIKQTCLLFTLLFISTGCTTTKVLVVKPELLHFDTPETTGSFLAGDINVHVAAKTPKYEFGKSSVTDFDASRSVSTSEKVSDNSYFNLGLNLGLIKRIDFFMRTRGVAGLKIQVLGTSKANREDGWKMAISSYYGNYAYVQSDNELLIFGSSSDLDLSLTGKTIGYTINTGYRFNPKLLAYTNIFHNKTDVTGTYNFNPSTSFRKERIQKARGILFGLNILNDNKSSFFTLEAGLTRSSWSSLGTEIYTPIGASIGYFW